MKKGKNKARKVSKRRQKVQKGQVGAGGVATATAPRKLPFLNLPMVGKANKLVLTLLRAMVRNAVLHSQVRGMVQLAGNVHVLVLLV